MKNTEERSYEAEEKQNWTPYVQAHEVGKEDEWGSNGADIYVTQVTRILWASNNQIPNVVEKFKAPCRYELYALQPVAKLMPYCNKMS